MTLARFAESLARADAVIFWRLLMCALALAVASLVVAHVLGTARNTVPRSQLAAAGIACLLLLIYAAGECMVEGLSMQTIKALALPVSFLGLIGLNAGQSRAGASSAAGAQAAQPPPVLAAVPARASENRRAA